MLVLGIESSCDETAAAVTDGEARVLSSVVATQHDLHAEYGGVVPEIASRAHAERVLPVITKALEAAGLSPADLGAVAVGNRPGLIGSLLVGLSAGKALAWSLGVPFVGVDHVRAHLHACRLYEPGRGEADPGEIEWPALGLVVSGGHTSLYRMEHDRKVERIGATADDAVGEAFDKVASMLGLPQPGGPAVERVAGEDGADERAFDFPIGKAAHELGFSFSGLKTAVLYEVKGRPQPRKVPGKPEVRHEPAPELTPERVRDVAASFQRAAVRAVVKRLAKAVRLHPGYKTLVIGGGVSANRRLRAHAETFADEHAMALRLAPMRFCVDNAAMIAGFGAVRLEAGQRDELDLPALPTTAC